MSNSAVSKGKKRKSDSGAEVWFILLFNCILFYSKTLEGLPFALNFSSYHILIVTYSHFTFHIIDIKYHNKHQILYTRKTNSMKELGIQTLFP
jgi:hypothetical protein